MAHLDYSADLYPGYAPGESLMVFSLQGAEPQSLDYPWIPISVPLSVLTVDRHPDIVDIAGLMTFEMLLA